MTVEAASVNFADILYCRGTYQDKPPLPFTPGLEVAGTDPSTGERLFGPVVMPHGGYAEQAVLGSWHPCPEGMTAAQASGFFVAYQTGWCALHHRTTLRAGETLLVHAAAGGVGAAAVQLGLAAGRAGDRDGRVRRQGGGGASARSARGDRAGRRC